MDGAITLHKDLAESGRWSEMPFAQQMANIGSEVFRAENWKKKGKPARMQNAVDRALELLDFTVQTMLHDHRTPRELLRLRELICDYFYGDNFFLKSRSSASRVNPPALQIRYQFLSPKILGFRGFFHTQAKKLNLSLVL